MDRTSGAAFALLTSILVTLLASSSAPTPLYATYQARWGFSPVTVTVVFGVYAVAVLVSLLVLGALSDHIGRRPVLTAALVAQAGVMLLFATASGLDVLLARSRPAGPRHRRRRRGDRRRRLSICTRDAARWPTPPGRWAERRAERWSRRCSCSCFPLRRSSSTSCCSGCSCSRRPACAGSPRPPAGCPGRCARCARRLPLPGPVRGALAVAAPSLIAVWALAGFYASLGPSLAALVDGSNSTILGGAALFVLAGSGALTVLAFHRTDARTFALAGAGLIILGVALVLAAVPTRSPILFFTGTAIAGAGFGAGFQGGLRTIVPLAGPAERAGVIAVIYVISYLALGLPAIGAGVLVVHTTVTHTAVLFGLGVIALAASTAVAILLNARRTRARETSTATARCLATR